MISANVGVQIVLQWKSLSRVCCSSWQRLRSGAKRLQSVLFGAKKLAKLVQFIEGCNALQFHPWIGIRCATAFLDKRLGVGVGVRGGNGWSRRQPAKMTRKHLQVVLVLIRVLLLNADPNLMFFVLNRVIGVSGACGPENRIVLC